MEKGTLRACLDQTTLALAEARSIAGWWRTLGPDVRRRYRESEELIERLRLDAGGPVVWPPRVS